MLGFISGPADFRHVAHHSRPGRTSPSFGLTNNVDDSDKVILRDQAKARKKPSFPGAMPPARICAEARDEKATPPTAGHAPTRRT